jgi:xanthine dehydrogenase YagS FAD-binding subunit
MQPFSFSRITEATQAISAAARASTAQQGAEVRFVAGGTTLIDLMKLNVEVPQHVVDINHLPLGKIERRADGKLWIGALVRNSDLAHHPDVKKDYTVLSEALLSGASAQLRNMATTSGNLLQRTRCVYFRDADMPCNKRKPGSGCSALHAGNRNLAILGTSEQCIATNPSDMNVALASLEAEIAISGADGERQVPIGDFYLLPGETPHLETILMPGDLITHVILPPKVEGARSHYLKLRDRASYEFALASAAVVLAMHDGVISHVRIALGGVGTVPWRCSNAEKSLEGKKPASDVFAAAASLAMRDAKPQSENGFKVELATRCLAHTLKTVAAI